MLETILNSFIFSIIFLLCAIIFGAVSEKLDEIKDDTNIKNNRSNKMLEQEKRIEAVAKIEAIKNYIYSLQEEYEKWRDADNFDDLQAFEKNEINGKEKILLDIKDFIENL